MLDLKGMKERRRLKIVTQLQKGLSDLLREKGLLSAADGTFVVISRIQVSDDYSHARVYCSSFGELAKDAVARLQLNAKTIRGWLAAKRLARHCPDLTFCEDEQQQKVHKLLASLK